MGSKQQFGSRLYCLCGGCTRCFDEIDTVIFTCYARKPDSVDSVSDRYPPTDQFKINDNVYGLYPHEHHKESTHIRHFTRHCLKKVEKRIQLRTTGLPNRHLRVFDKLHIFYQHFENSWKQHVPYYHRIPLSWYLNKQSTHVCYSLVPPNIFFLKASFICFYIFFFTKQNKTKNAHHGHPPESHTIVIFTQKERQSKRTFNNFPLTELFQLLHGTRGGGSNIFQTDNANDLGHPSDNHTIVILQHNKCHTKLDRCIRTQCIVCGYRVTIYRSLFIYLFYMCIGWWLNTKTEECKSRMGCHFMMIETTETVFIRQVACSLKL